MALSAEEEAQGWRSLFDGTLEGWRGFMTESVPETWSAQDGVLVLTPGDDYGVDIMTVDQFTDFELRFEWRLETRGNTGVFFRVTEEAPYPYWTGPEMQLLDNGAHPDGQNPLTSAGAAYGIYAPSEDATRPTGEWNEAAVRVEGNMVTHWLNGVEVVSYELMSPEWQAIVAETKFAKWPKYGVTGRGHIAFQDHTDPAWFRNIRILELN